MTDTAITTKLKIEADTQSARRNIFQLDQATEKFSKGSVPALGSGFGQLTQQIAMTSGAAQALGINTSSMAGTFGLLGQTLGMIHPALLGVTFAAGLLTSVFINKRNATKAVSEELTANATALKNVAKGNDEAAGAAKELIRLNNELLTQQIKQIESQIALAQGGARETTTLEKLASGFLSVINHGVPVVQMYADLDKGSDEYTKKLIDLIARLDKLRSGLVDLEPPAKKVKDITDELKLAWTQAAMAQQGLAPNYQTMMRLADQAAALMRRLAIQEAEDRKLTEEQKLYFLDITEIKIQEMYDRLRQTAKVSFEGTTVDLANETNYQVAIWARAQNQQVMATARASRIQGALFQATQKAFGAAAMGQISIAQAVAQSVIGFATEAAAGELEAKAKVWAAEAIAAAAQMNFAKAAGLTAAVVAAVGSAALIRSIGAAGVGGGDVQTEQQGLSGTGEVTLERGRTVVQRGPVTMNYSATMVIQDSAIVDVEDLHRMWDQWNIDLLRRAGLDVNLQAAG